jgi:hypothetical protein
MADRELLLDEGQWAVVTMYKNLLITGWERLASLIPPTMRMSEASALIRIVMPLHPW